MPKDPVVCEFNEHELCKPELAVFWPKEKSPEFCELGRPELDDARLIENSPEPCELDKSELCELEGLISLAEPLFTLDLLWSTGKPAVAVVSDFAASALSQSTTSLNFSNKCDA